MVDGLYQRLGKICQMGDIYSQGNMEVQLPLTHQYDVTNYNIKCVPCHFSAHVTPLGKLTLHPSHTQLIPVPIAAPSIYLL